MYITLENITSIAIGGFDGIHLAHQKLFDHLSEEGAVVAIETGHATMTPGIQRQKYTRYPVIIYALDTIRHLDDAGFVAHLMRQFPSLKRIVVGYDFRFGSQRRFDASHLQAHFSGEVVVVAEVTHEGISVHSNTIRTLLKEGDIAKANALLNRPYSISGNVIQGQGLGKKSFVPTLNITPIELIPAFGVYITRTTIHDRSYPSITFIGARHTTEGGFAVETHLLDTSVEEVHACRIEFLSFVRSNKKFESFDALFEAIQADIKKAQVYHAY